ncbi:MAG: M20/M25/M40 family metallo-hydrolase, partial [Promethearchaeota archaeon]
MIADNDREKFESVISLAQKLISINSEPEHKEFEVEQFLWNYLLNLGFYLEKVPYAEKRNNIVAIYPKPEDHIVDHYIAFSGHMDTVPGYMEGDGYQKDGKIYGRGSTDMKGGIAAILTSVKSFLTAHKRASE